MPSTPNVRTGARTHTIAVKHTFSAVVAAPAARSAPTVFLAASFARCETPNLESKFCAASLAFPAASFALVDTSNPLQGPRNALDPKQFVILICSTTTITLVNPFASATERGQFEFSKSCARALG